LPLCENLGVLGAGHLVLLGAATLERNPVSLPLEHGGGHQSLDLGSLELLLLSVLEGERTFDDILANVVILGQVEQLPDLGGSLGPETAGDGVVGEAGNLLVALFDDGHGEHGEVTVHDASAHGFTLAFTSAARAVAGVALGKEKLHTAVGQHTLLHGESLLVVTPGDAENVTLELVPESVGGDLSAHALLVKGTDLVLIVDLNQLLAAGGWER